MKDRFVIKHWRNHNMSMEKINAAKAEIAATSAYQIITEFFDADSFCKIDAFARSGEGFAEVVAGYGTVEGMPVYAFAQNSDICGGAMSKAQAAKLRKLYSLALKTGAPVVGFYDSLGGRLTQGTELLAGTGELLRLASKLSGAVPQVSVVLGTCLGTNALNAASADIVLMTEDAQLSLDVTGKNSDAQYNASHGNAAVIVKDKTEAVEKARELVTYLPSNNLVPAPQAEDREPDGENTKCIVSKLVDAGSKLRIADDFGDNARIRLARLGGQVIGVVRTTGGKLDCKAANKAAKFVRFCDAFSIPVITFVDCDGFEGIKAAAKLTSAYAEATTGWTDDYLWDNGQKTNAVTIPMISTSRTYTCQYANQSGAVSESRFYLKVENALQHIIVGSGESETNEIQVLKGTAVTLKLIIPTMSSEDDVVWPDGSRGVTYSINNVEKDMQVNATYQGVTYTYYISVKAADYGYYDILTTEQGYKLVTSSEELSSLAEDNYFIIASNQANLLIGLKDAPKNGNKALFFQSPVTPYSDLSKVFTIEPYGDAFCLRNIDYDGLLLQTEWDRPDQLRTHDQSLACEWTRLLLSYADGAWTVENGKYPGNWLGLWTPSNGYRDGEEIAFNKNGDDIARLQIFAISKKLFHSTFITKDVEKDITPLLVNPQFTGNGFGWKIAGSGGNNRYNGAVEVWHRSNVKYSQTISGLPDGRYTVTCQMVNGEGSNTGNLFAMSGDVMETTVVSQSCAGSTFDAQRDRMSANAYYGLLSVDIEVIGGVLTVGVQEPSSNTWLVWDNFTLTYKGSATGVRNIESHLPATGLMYDLQGRRLLSVPQKGIFIMDGKKFVR